MVNMPEDISEELEEIRMARRKPGFFRKAKAGLERFRERQIELGERARERQLARLEQKTRIAEQRAKLEAPRTQVELSRAKVRQEFAKTRRMEAAGGGLFGSPRPIGVARPSPRVQRKFTRATTRPPSPRRRSRRRPREASSFGEEGGLFGKESGFF